MKKRQAVKCVVWDLDGTIWDGTLLEDQEVSLRKDIREIIKTLDSRGIVHSIASKNEYNDAITKLEAFDLYKYFLYPEINWSAKSISITKIQKNLNISTDSIIFIDDEQFEIDEVRSSHPDILCLHAFRYKSLLNLPCLNSKFITEDSKRRRVMYHQTIERTRAEESYKGPKKDFLASLGMKLFISEATEQDLQRAVELTIRTNQLNATGKTYSYEKLRMLMEAENHKLLICELLDKYGSYGKIGLALIELTEYYWCLRLLLMSCRVMSRGVGTVLLSHIMRMAKKAGTKLKADFKHTGRNKMMYITYKFANFKEISSQDGDTVILENDLTRIQEFPPYIDVNIK
jgi:FkbH-like protein